MRKVLALLMILTIISGSAFAAEPSSWKKEGDTYGTKIRNKFWFGLANTAFGWTELFQEPAEAYQSKECVLTGFGKGLWHTVADTVGGAVHLVTFWCPKTDIPLPEGGVDLCKKRM